MTAETQTQTAATQKRYVKPLVNIVDRKDQVVVEAELPGVTKDGVELSFDNGELTLIGHLKENGSSGRPHYTERVRADYRRVFALSKAIDATKIEAAMDNGLLTITLPKVEAVKPRNININ